MQRIVSRKNIEGVGVGGEGEETFHSPSSFLPPFPSPFRHTEARKAISLLLWP